MYRQHPYSGYGAAQGRRTDSPPGPGPDRTRPTSDRGYGRGRGGGSLRRGGGAPGAMSSFTSYESPYPGPALDNPYAEDAYNFRNGAHEEYSQFESHPDASRNGRLPRNTESKGHDPLIEERLQRERPCRTLFIRNIKYETDSNEFRHRFEEFGEIKTFFDLISHRGMVFCTYFDMRAAERAKERLQGTELAGRPIDVHYSLPRDDQKNELNQGIITVTLIDSPSRGPIDDMELRRKLTSFGDVKSIQGNGGRSDSRTVEFYDLRSAEEAHEKLRHQALQDGVMETDWVFLGDQIIPPGPAMQERARMEKGGPPVPTPRGRGRGGRGRGGRGGFDDRRGRDWEEDEYYNRERGRLSPARYEDRYRGRSPPPRARSNGDLAADKDKLEQAKKVQDLLAALKQTGTSSTTTAPAAPPAAQQMYYPSAASGVPSYGLPPNMAHLSALFAQLPPHQAAAAAAAIQQMQGAPNYGAPPPQLAPPMPPPSALYGASQAQYSYSPPSQSSANASNNYPNHSLYALLDQQKSPPQGNASHPNSAPPEAARFNYGASAPNPPAAGSTNTQTPSIQDIMALLKNSS